MLLSLVNLFRTLSTQHLMLQSFAYGDSFNIQKAGEDIHPQLYVEYPFTITYNVGYKDVAMTYYLSDIPGEAQFDDVALLDKIEQINEDLLLRLQLLSYEEFSEVVSINALTLNQWQGDDCVAIRTEITFRIARNSNSCNAPFNVN